MLAEEDKNAEEKSPLDGAWYKRKCNNPGWNRLLLCYELLTCLSCLDITQNPAYFHRTAGVCALTITLLINHLAEVPSV